MAKITIKDTDIIGYKKRFEDYTSLIDMAKVSDRDDLVRIISLWLRTYIMIENIGLRELLNNPDFKPHINEGVKNESFESHFWMSPQKWISETNAIGFGMTDREWREANPDLKGNICDYATINEMINLSNMRMLCKRELGQHNFKPLNFEGFKKESVLHCYVSTSRTASTVKPATSKNPSTASHGTSPTAAMNRNTNACKLIFKSINRWHHLKPTRVF